MDVGERAGLSACLCSAQHRPPPCPHAFPCLQHVCHMNSNSGVEKGRVRRVEPGLDLMALSARGNPACHRGTQCMLPPALQNIARNRPHDLFAQNR